MATQITSMICTPSFQPNLNRNASVIYGNNRELPLKKFFFHILNGTTSLHIYGLFWQ